MKNDFTKEIEEALQEYSSIASDTLKKVIINAGKNAVKELKKTSPKGNYNGGGAYAKSWKFKRISDAPTSIKSVVYAGNGEYRLTHLLEKGHAKRNGGRTRAFPHIAKAERNAIDAIEKELKRQL